MDEQGGGGLTDAQRHGRHVADLQRQLQVRGRGGGEQGGGAEGGQMRRGMAAILLIGRGSCR